MFNKNRDINKSIRIDTLIGQNTHINGDISFNGGLRIDGSIAGNINATGNCNSVLTLSEKGSIEGEVRVPNLVINGIIIGNLYASEHVDLASKARIQGNVYYHFLEMAMGSSVNGRMIHISESEEHILGLEHHVFVDYSNPELERKDQV